MRGLIARSNLFGAIDAANAADPNMLRWRGTRWPRAQLQGVLASRWLPRLTAATADPALDPCTAEAVPLAARAHHLRRWTIARDRYAEGRTGYLRWRRALKDVHAAAVGELLSGHVEPELIRRVQALVRKDDLGRDPGAQLVEDAICLTFLETQFEPLADRLDHARLVNAVQKTARKMSPAAVALLGAVELSPSARGALGTALAAAPSD